MLSFDIEDWFHSSDVAPFLNGDDWENNELRVVRNTLKLLDILNTYNKKATFFVLGWVAEKVPELIYRIYAQGHEIASHGYSHKLIYKMSKEEFRADVRKSKGILEDIVGTNIIGYRAPDFSISNWAIQILKEEGFFYDSSYFPVLYHDRYGKINFRNSGCMSNITEIKPNFYEIMLSSYEIMKIKIPWSGGGYFRFIPYPIYSHGVKKITKKQGGFVFYLHPWEIDPDQPRAMGMKWHNRIRQYAFLKFTESRLRKLLATFQFDSIRSLLSVKGLI